MNKWSIPALLLLLTCLSCREQAAEEQRIAFSMSDTMLSRCTLYTTRMQEVRERIRLFGKIAVDNNRMAPVYPVLGGSVLSVDVELGDYVRQGQVLARVRSSEVAEFQRQRLDAQSDVAVAQKNLQVMQDLFEGKLSSEKEVIAAEKELEKAQAELARVLEIYEIYKLEPGSVYSITAPISGFILSKNIYPNEQLRPDMSEPLFSISEISEVWALANVSESDIARVRVGFDAEVNTLGFPDEVYKGKVDKIFNAIDPETKAMKVRVKLPNPGFRLKPEMMATVNVFFNTPDRMVAVPSSAVVFDKNKNWVMVFHDRHRIETVQVEVYAQAADTTYIRTGLQEGLQVISTDALMVYDALND